MWPVIFFSHSQFSSHHGFLSLGRRLISILTPQEKFLKDLIVFTYSKRPAFQCNIDRLFQFKNAVSTSLKWYNLFLIYLSKAFPVAIISTGRLSWDIRSYGWFLLCHFLMEKATLSRLSRVLPEEFSDCHISPKPHASSVNATLYTSEYKYPLSFYTDRGYFRSSLHVLVSRLKGLRGCQCPHK